MNVRWFGHVARAKGNLTNTIMQALQSKVEGEQITRMASK